MTQIERCIKELELAGLFKKDSAYDGMIGEAVKELLLTFQKQGHSGYSATLTASLFNTLIMREFKRGIELKSDDITTIAGDALAEVADILERG